MSQVGAAQVIPLTTLNATGTISTSGAPGATDTSGPFLIERQSMTIDYSRIPYGAFNFTPSSTTLSGVSGTSHHVYGTKLVAEVRATYSRKKSYDFFSTTAFQQPQKFEILALSADDKGTTYGNTNASAMGPQGSVITKKEFYKRTPWIDGIHTEVTRSVQGRTYYATEVGNGGVTATVDSDGLAQDFNAWMIHEGMEGSFLRWNSRLPAGGGGYIIYGRYNTSKESLRKIRQFIDDIGLDITREVLFDNPATPHPASRLDYPRAIPDLGFAEYDAGRHDYD